MVKTLRLPGIILALLLVVVLVTIGCAKATPTSAPAPTVTVTATPAPAPTVTTTAVVTATPAPAPTVTVTAAPTPTPVAKPTMKLPKVVGLGTYGVGTSGYVRVAAISPVIEQRLGVPVRAVPVDTSIARFSMLRSGETMLVMDSITGDFNVLTGREEFASKEWGPQKIRTLWGFAPSNYTIAVMADTPFKTIADLKGKRVPGVPGLKYVEEMLDAILAFGGLDPAKDVVKVPTAGWVQQHRAAAEGQTDAMIAAPHTPIITELAATPRGVRLFPLPADDTEGWKRIRASVSGTLAYPMVNQIGIKEAQGMPMASWAMYIVTTADMDEEFVYQVVKALDELNATYKDKEPTLPFFSAKAIQDMGILDRGLPMIHHPGMVRYLKEVGVWKPAHEAWQVRLLGWELEVQGKWLDAIATAEKQGIKVDPLNAEWLKLWDTMRPKVPEFQK